MNSIRVLCVENQSEYLDVLKYLLESAGYEVLAATTGRQGVSMLTSEPFHGVLLEYDLPDATGTPVWAEMKRIKPGVPVLLFAGIGTQSPFLLCFFDSYIRDAESKDSVPYDFDC